MKNTRFLIGGIAIETKNARLNGSSKDVEASSSSLENVSYTKKIKRGWETFPYASGHYVKKNIKEFNRNNGHNISHVRALDTTQSITEGNPFKNYDEDLMGFMNATKVVLSEEEYMELEPEEQVGFKKKTKGNKSVYEKNITKKRKARLMVSPLQAISNTKIQEEFCTKETDKTNGIFVKEVYSNIMSLGFNLDIINTGVYNVSEDESGFRDYAPEEVEALKLDVNDENIILLDKIEKLKRIEDTLRAFEFFNTKITQSTNLEDLNTKFVILTEYSAGNNIFNNIFRNGKLDIDYLLEAIEENEMFRLSKTYIGVRSGFVSVGNKEDNKDLKKVLEERFKDNPMIEVGSVKNAFDKYLEYLKETL